MGCYCQEDGCSRVQLGGLFDVGVGQKEGIIPSGRMAAAEKKGRSPGGRGIRRWRGGQAVRVGGSDSLKGARGSRGLSGGCWIKGLSNPRMVESEGC